MKKIIEGVVEWAKSAYEDSFPTLIDHADKHDVSLDKVLITLLGKKAKVTIEEVD